jgi:hypothetical protein
MQQYEGIIEMQHLVGKTVQFTEKMEDIEAYPESGMRARILSVCEQDTDKKDLHDHLYLIVFDYSEFDDFNRQFESNNYYDKNGVACLNAREANQYQMQETIYFGSPTLFPFEDYFTLLNQRQTVLLARFQESGSTNYVEWLENQVEV